MLQLCSMCLIVLAYKVHPRYPLVLTANRDEFLDRPTAPAHFWADKPHVFAGRDKLAGGTWMAVARNGRFAALTNYRDVRLPMTAGPSRGMLVTHALEHGLKGHDTGVYAGFNLLYGEVGALHYHNNIDGRHMPLAPGIHGLSNHLLNTDWPKVERARSGMEAALDMKDGLREALFGLLADERPAPDERLPDTGLGLEQERALSPIHIRTKGYGTRCSTVILVDHTGRVEVEERGHVPASLGRTAFTI